MPQQLPIATSSASSSSLSSSSNNFIVHPSVFYRQQVKYSEEFGLAVYAGEDIPVGKVVGILEGERFNNKQTAETKYNNLFNVFKEPQHVHMLHLSDQGTSKISASITNPVINTTLQNMYKYGISSKINHNNHPNIRFIKFPYVYQSSCTCVVFCISVDNIAKSQQLFSHYGHNMTFTGFTVSSQSLTISPSQSISLSSSLALLAAPATSECLTISTDITKSSEVFTQLGKFNLHASCCCSPYVTNCA
jgi:hypothetical protein